MKGSTKGREGMQHIQFNYPDPETGILRARSRV
jgi:hypothetical protein